MSKYKTTIKLQEMIEWHFDGTFKTKEERIESKLPIIKVIKIALKYDCSFKVGWNKNIMNRNLNYIEITSRDMFFKERDRNNWKSLKKSLGSWKL